MAYNRKKYTSKEEWLEYNNFNKAGIAYCVYGDNTYSIKDWLKEQGCSYSPLLKWHIAEEIELPDGYKLKAVSFDDIYTWDMGDAWEKESAKGYLKKLFEVEKAPSSSMFYNGKIGERVYNITATIDKIRGYQGAWGYSNIFTFKSGDYIFTWFTQSCPDVEEHDVVDLTFTIKDFKEYMGESQTVITRAKLVKIGG